MTPHIPESWLVDWNLVITMGIAVPPRDPKDDDDEDEDDDDDDDEEEHEDEEPPVIREPDEDE
jgi:hypothetical protein